jgi:hypothetical protein
MSSPKSLRVFAGVFLLTALFIGCALAQENATSAAGNATPASASTLPPPTFVKPPQIIPSAAIPIIQELGKTPSYIPAPLKYVTSSDPTQQSSFDTHALYPFSYRGQSYLLSIPYNIAAYESAWSNNPNRNSQRQLEIAGLLTLMPNTWWEILPTEGDWKWWDSQMNDSAEYPMYDSIVSQLSAIRDQKNLTDDEYAELIARFVQRAVPNGDQGLVEKYPIETIATHSGGSKDKAMLLAQLYCHAGYGAAIIYFPMANTFVVGIPGDHKAPEYDGYIAIDPMNDGGFFGFDDARATSVKQLNSWWGNYAVGPQCDGKGYTAGMQVRIIQDIFLTDFFGKAKPEFAKDLIFLNQNKDNRPLVFNYYTETGPFRFAE